MVSCGEDYRVILASEFLLLAEKTTRKKIKEATVHRAYKGMKKKMVSLNLPLQEVDTKNDCLLGPLSSLTLSTACNAMTRSKMTVKKNSREIIPGIKVAHQTSHQVHVAAQNSLVAQQLRNSAMKEATAAWKAELDLKFKGEPHETMKKQIIDSINTKPQYKGHVKV
jgi:hypothetical protein